MIPRTFYALCLFSSSLLAADPIDPQIRVIPEWTLRISEDRVFLAPPGVPNEPAPANLPAPANAPRRLEEWKELDWSRFLAKAGGDSAEYVLPDATRVDIYDLDDNVAWEVEWSHKWPEAVGQSLAYAMKTGANPGMYILIKPGSEKDYLNLVNLTHHLRAHGINMHLRFQKVR